MKPGIGLIGKKLGMAQFFQPTGQPVPVTVVEAGPCTVVQAKTVEKDGYRAVQLGVMDTDAKKLSKPQQGHCAKVQVGLKKIWKEFRMPSDQEFKVGSSVTVELFKVGDRVDITGTSLGKGFQGGVARWHWKGGPQTHGSMSHRRPGSIGSSTDPSRVFKGHHLPGHMGNEKKTTQAIEIIQVDVQQNLLLVKGAVPGHQDSILLIRKSRKPPRTRIAQPHKKKGAPAAGKAPAAKAAAAKDAGAKKSGK